LEQEALMRLHTTIVGGGPTPLVFLHGLFGQGKNFTAIARELSDTCTSLLVDLPNHGRSGWTHQIDYPHLAELVVPTVTAFELGMGHHGGVALLGHSMGGKVAMRFALDHPELVERLAVVDISPVRTISVRTGFSPIVNGMRRINLATLASRKHADQQLLSAVPDTATRAFLLQNLHFDHGRPTHPTIQRHWRWQMNLRVLGDQLDHIGDWPDTDGRSYDGPVVWIGGQDSDYIRPEHHTAMRTLFPRIVSVTLKGAGHWVHADQPDAFTATLRAFLDSPA